MRESDPCVFSVRRYLCESDSGPIVGRPGGNRRLVFLFSGLCFGCRSVGPRFNWSDDFSCLWTVSSSRLLETRLYRLDGLTLVPRWSDGSCRGSYFPFLRVCAPFCDPVFALGFPRLQGTSYSCHQLAWVPIRVECPIFSSLVRQVFLS